MHTFHDGQQRQWTFAVNVLAVKRVRDQTGFDLLVLMDPGNAMFEKLATDVVSLCEVMIALLSDQLKAAGVTAEEFLQALDNEEIVRTATRACLEAILSFSRKPKALLMKQAFGKVWEATERREETQLRQAQELVDSPQFDQLVDQTAQSVIPGKSSSN